MSEEPIVAVLMCSHTGLSLPRLERDEFDMPLGVVTGWCAAPWQQEAQQLVVARVKLGLLGWSSSGSPVLGRGPMAWIPARFVFVNFCGPTKVLLAIVRQVQRCFDSP